ncbi:MAG: hypothetical protein ICV64_12495 [Thermoleophilia bacterium]|nr:hypothetical protein [Thermoleophilia bacterium]
MAGIRGHVDPLWARAPVALLRFPGLLAAVSLGSLLLALAAAAGPLFVSSTANAALEDELDGYTVYGAGVSLLQGSISLEKPGGDDVRARIERTTAALDEALADVPTLRPSVTSVVGPVVSPSATPTLAAVRPVRLVAREGALAHVTPIAGHTGEGVWLADDAARGLGLRPGDQVFLRYRNAPVRTNVDGIYRALWKEAPTAYWRTLAGLIYVRNPDAGPPPTFVLADANLVVSLSERLRGEFVDVRRDWPLATTRLTLEDAEPVGAALERFHAATQDSQSAVARALRCAGCPTGLFGERIEYASQLPSAIETTRATVASLRGPIDLVSLAAVLVALAVLTTSAAFALAGRSVETGFLVAHGFGPGSIGTRMALEAALPAVAGAATGLGVAVVVVTVLGPGPLAAGAVREAAGTAAVALPAAVALVGLVAAGFFMRALPRRPSPRPGLLRRVPWETAVLAAAGYALWRVRTNGGLDAAAGDTARPSWPVLAFPLLFIAGGAGIAARLLSRLLALLRAVDLGWGALFLAIRRLAAGGELVAILVTACALAAGTAVYARAVVRSLEATTDAKARLFVGSDVQGFTSANREIPRGFPFPATIVTKLEGAAIGNVSVDVLAIEPESLAETVYWDGSWSDRPLGDLLSGLKTTASGRLSVVAAGNVPAGDLLDLQGTELRIRRTGEAEAFPGMSLDRPLVVADRRALARAVEQAGTPDPVSAGRGETQVWARGDARRVIAALEATTVRPFPVVTADEVRANPAIRSVTQTFRFLGALGLAAALAALVGTLLYAQARHRARVVSFALARRMGLSAGTHRLANGLELAWMLVAGTALGSLLALAAARLVLPELDAPVRLPSGPLFRAPWPFAAAAAATALLTAAAAGAAGHALVRRANLAKVLRADE